MIFMGTGGTQQTLMYFGARGICQFIVGLSGTVIAYVSNQFRVQA